MSKKYDSVIKMIRDISSDDKSNALISEEINKKRISKLLFLLRCKNNLTQKQIAEKMGCSQGTISKIEGSYDDALSVKELSDYGRALNLQLEIGYRHTSMKITDLIKYHAFRIKQYLNQLTSLAKNDESIKKGIAKFHLEAILNIGKIISDSLSSLKIIPEKNIQDKRRIHLSPPHENVKDFIDDSKAAKK